jgi:hypothetical protein
LRGEGTCASENLSVKNGRLYKEFWKVTSPAGGNGTVRMQAVNRPALQE